MLECRAQGGERHHVGDGALGEHLPGEQASGDGGGGTALIELGKLARHAGTTIGNCLHLTTRLRVERHAFGGADAHRAHQQLRVTHDHQRRIVVELQVVDDAGRRFPFGQHPAFLPMPRTPGKAPLVLAMTPI
ncbi:MAG: hypothetical protein L0H80_07705 [Propionibacterium sp.]|nr:hypothetical protein [Propionibacterium sp.]